MEIMLVLITRTSRQSHADVQGFTAAFHHPLRRVAESCDATSLHSLRSIVRC